VQREVKHVLSCDCDMMMNQKVKQLKTEVFALYYAYKDPRVPWYAKLFVMIVVGYAFSPIDLIPDFIPVLGYVDDVLLLPSLIWLAVWLLPPEVLVECRGQADEWMQTKGSKPSSRAGAVLIVVLWLALGAMTWFWLKPRP